jgi:hypothetical protein
VSTNETRLLAWRYNWWRQSELEGALLLGRMIGTVQDRDLAARLTRHCAEEAAHSRLWAEVIAELELPHVRIFRSYQSFYLRHSGPPARLLDVSVSRKFSSVTCTRAFTRKRACRARPRPPAAPTGR